MTSARFNSLSRCGLIVTTAFLLPLTIHASRSLAQQGIILTTILGESAQNIDVTESGGNPTATVTLTCCNPLGEPIIPRQGTGGEAVENLINDLVIFTGAPPNLTKWNDLNAGQTSDVPDPNNPAGFIPGFMMPVEIQLSQPRTVRFYTLTSANDAVERDPYEWRFLGTNVDNPAPSDFVLLEERTGVEFTAFHQTQLFGPVTNNTAYRTYRFEFETQYVAQGAANYPAGLAIPNSIQLAEVELFENFAGGGAKLLINRGTGGVQLQNAGTTALDITGYSIISPAGTLNSNSWTSIADNADGDSGGSLDTDNWIRLTDANARRDLSEVENPDGTGGISVAASSSLNLGNAWIKFPTEDVTAELLLSDGSTLPVSVTYEGGNAYRFGDLNFDRNATLTFQDWTAFKAGQGFNFSTIFSAAESYAKGDLDGDFDHDLNDYAVFKGAYDAANGAGAFVAMVSSVPEPTSAVLFGLALVIAAAPRFRRRGAMIALVGVTLMLTGTSASHAGQVVPNLLGFDLTDPDNVAPPDVTITAGDEANSPAAEMPPMALDNNRNTKWLALLPAGTFYQMQFNSGPKVVDAYTISSANDAPERDPYEWTLSGSNDGTTFTVLDTQTNQDFATRFETQQFTFTNTTAYSYYQFDFLTESGAGGPNPGAPNSIQLSEIELFDFAAPLAMEVNAATGAISITNDDPGAQPIDAYRIRSAAGSLNRDAWWGAGAQGAANGGQSIHDQTIAGFPRGNGTGNGWEEGPGSTDNELVEWFLGSAPAGQGFSSFTPGQVITMNGIFRPGSAQDLQFDYRSNGRPLQGVISYVGTPAGVTGDFNGNGTVDAADYVLWRNGGNLQNDPTPGLQAEDYGVWRANFGRTGGGPGLGSSAAVPEPASLLLALLGPMLLVGSRRRSATADAVNVNNIEKPEPILRRSAMATNVRTRSVVGLTCVMMVCLSLATSALGSTLDRDYKLGDDPLENAVVGQIVGNSSPTPPGPGFTLDSATLFQDLMRSGSPTYVSTQATGRPGASATERGVQFTGSSSQYLTGDGLGSPREGGANIGHPDYANTRLMQVWARPTVDTGARQDVISDTYQFGISISANDMWGHTYGGDVATGIGTDYVSTAPVAYNEWTHIMQRTLDNDGVILYVNGVAVSRFNATYTQVTGGVGDVNMYVGAGLGGASNFFTGQIDNIKLHVAEVFVPEPPDLPVPVQWGAVNLGTENDFIASRNLVTGDVNGDGVVNGTGSGPAATDDVSFFVEHWLDERRVNTFLTGDLMSRTTMGDLNFDGRTSLADWSILRGAHAAGASLDLASLLGTSVPEPSTILLGAWSILVACGARRARHQRA